MVTCWSGTRTRSWPTSRRATCPARRPARSTSSRTTRPRWRSTTPRPRQPGPPSARPGCAGAWPYKEFAELWVTPEPPAHLPYYGSWGDDNSVVHATAWSTHGSVRVAGPVSQLPQIFLPGPNVIALAGLLGRRRPARGRGPRAGADPRAGRPGGRDEARPGPDMTEPQGRQISRPDVPSVDEQVEPVGS